MSTINFEALHRTPQYITAIIDDGKCDCGQCMETKMNTEQPKTDRALDYIRDRVRNIFFGKEREIDEAYADPIPSTLKETKKWLEEGNYRFDLPKGIADDFECYAWSYFHWGKDKPDYEARDAAYEALSKAKEDLRDKVTIITDEKERLAALEEFKNQKFVQ